MKRNKENKVSLGEAFALNIKAVKLWHRNMPGYMLSSVGKCILSALAPYAGIYFAARILDELSGARDAKTLATLVLATLGTALVLGIAAAVFGRISKREASCEYIGCEKLYAQKLFSMDFHIVDDPHTHDLRSQIYQNSNWNGFGISDAVRTSMWLVEAVSSVAGALALCVSLFTLRVPQGEFVSLNSPLFSAAAIALLLAATLLSPALANKANEYYAKAAQSVKFANRAFNFFGFLPYDRQKSKDVRMYRQDLLCAASMGTLEFFKLMKKFSRGPIGGYKALSAVASGIFIGLVYLFVCLKAWAGAFGVGAVTQYIGAITALAGGVSMLIRSFGEIKLNAEFLKTTFEYLDMPNDMYQGSLTIEKRGDRKYEIEFKDVSFKYPSGDAWALRHVNFKFRVGERLAVVGRNGSGKTTFIKLLCRLYDPTEGEILLNGINIKKYDYREYMSIFSVVFQDFKLLAFGLGENVAASVDFDEAKAEDCLVRAGFGERLKAMPHGLKTMLYKDFDKEGVEISGGEAQKIAIARALYKDAPFIVLDEPTAALDPVAEFEIYSKFNEIVSDCTAVYISHRLASCRFLDDIAVFSNGSIVERGTHDALLAAGGEYSALWNAQAQYYTSAQA